MTTPAEHLDRLATIAQRRQALDGEQFAGVLDARLARCTWAEIGAALGVTAQAAQQRYAPRA